MTPDQKVIWSQRGLSGVSHGKCVIFTTSCSRVKPVATRATPKSPGWMIALSPIAPEGRWTPQDDPIQRSLAPNMGAKPGVENDQPMEPVDSRPFSDRSPQSRGLVPVVERRNAWQMKALMTRTGNESTIALCTRGGCRVGGPFRLSVCLTGGAANKPFNF